MDKGTDPAQRHPMRESHLLLVDDDPALLDALSGTLEARFGHFTLDTCESGAQALELAKQRPYDTIIVDVNMPHMNGLELLAEVKQLQPQTPVLMITAHANGTLMARAFDGGAADFIPKPFDREDLVQAVRRGLHLSRLQSVASKLEARHQSTLEQVGVARQELQQAARHRLENQPC
jgi:two-component system, sensor histidine kinase and response regulator